MSTPSGTLFRSKRRLVFRTAAILSVACFGVVLWYAKHSDNSVYDFARRAYKQYQKTRLDAVYQAQIDPLTLWQSVPQTNVPVRIAITVNTNVERHRISPLIYGMAFAPPNYLHDLRIPLNRWGGNDKTRYNWVDGNADNAARDWKWANRPAYTTPADWPEGSSSAADYFVAQNRQAGAETLLTVPTVGWVARNRENSVQSVDVPLQGGPPQKRNPDAILGYDPTANRTRTSVRSLPRKNAPFVTHPGTHEPVYQDEWLFHLTRRFGKAASGGVRFYAMDNEPDLWDVTHTDVHPVRPGYEELLTQFLTYAQAIKDVDPTALVTGPVLQGWAGLEYSPLDRGDDNFRTHAEQKRHGSKSFLPWWLGQVRQADQQAKRRTLDVLDVHFYPQGQGVFSGATDASTRALRLRSTRALWDASYTDESWIAQPVTLLPRLRHWINQEYPETLVGISEWNFGADNDISGALAILETLGVFGREDLFLANYWAYPSAGSPGYLAFKLLHNADGHGAGMGDVSCQAQSNFPERVSCFAALEESSSPVLTLLLINKMPQRTASIALTVDGRRSGGSTSPPAKVWRLSTASHHIESLSAQNVSEQTGQQTVLRLPPYSAMLVHFPQTTLVKTMVPTDVVLRESR